MSGPIPNISGVSHNYELFEFAKILCMNVIEYDTIPPRPQKPKPAVLPHGNPHIMIVKAAGYVGHAFIAIATENNYIILRYVGASGVPIVRHINWFKGERAKILDLAWCPEAHHLLVLTADLTIMLIPAANLILGKGTTQKNPNLVNIGNKMILNKRPVIIKAPVNPPIGALSHLGPSDDISILSGHTKAAKIHVSGHILWWRTHDRFDYAVVISTRGTIRFTNLHTQEVRQFATIKLQLALVTDVDLITDTARGSTYLLIQHTQGDPFQILLEQEIKGKTFRSIVMDREAKPSITQPFKLPEKRGTFLSVQHTSKRGTMIGAYYSATDKLEVYSTDLQSYPLFVYQLVSHTSMVHMTDRLIFTISNAPDKKSANVNVISSLIASTSDAHYFLKHQKDSIMQEFRFGKKIKGCFRSFPTKNLTPMPANNNSLEGFFVWTTEGLYECRPKKAPEEIFYELLSQNLEKTDAEPLGKTVGLDILHLYEQAADRYFERGLHGRALDLYFLSNVPIHKLVYKFLEIDRIDVVIQHLRTIVMKQRESLSSTERRHLANLLLFCYIYRLAKFDKSTLAYNNPLPSDNELKELNEFLNECEDYDHQKAVMVLLQLGMIRDMFTVWRTKTCDINNCLEILSIDDYLDLNQPAIETLLQIIEEKVAVQEIQDKQFHLFHSSFFNSLLPDIQVKLILRDINYVKKNLRKLSQCLPLLSTDTLIEVTAYFDPQGDIMKLSDLKQAENKFKISFDQVGESEKSYSAKPQDFVEVFLSALLCLCNRYAVAVQELKNQKKSKLFYSKLKLKNKQKKLEKKKKKKEKENSSDEEDEHAEKIKTQMKHKLKSSIAEKIESRLIAQVSCGSNHIVIITDIGELFSWGNNSSGQLGLGDESAVNIAFPTKVDLLHGKIIKHIACGGEFTIAVTSKMQIYTWGRGTSGQLGHGDNISISFPKQIAFFRSNPIDIIQVACTYEYTLLLSKKGNIIIFGSGILGNNKKFDCLSLPTKLDNVDYAVEIACGHSHSLYRNKNGQVFSWGRGNFGQLGHGDFFDCLSPKPIQSLHTIKILKIACGYFHSLAITDLHNLYTWGKGSRGKLGHEDENDENSPKLVKAFAYQPIKNIAAGYWQSMAISDEGLYIWGSTKNGQLGIGETGEDQLRPTLLPGLKDLNLIKIAASDGFSVAISDAQDLYCWGWNVGDPNHSFSTDPRLIELRETKHFRVVGEENGAGNEIKVEKDPQKQLEFYQKILENTLKSKYPLYRPTLLLQQASDYQNFIAAAVIYQQMQDWYSEVKCRLIASKWGSENEKQINSRNLLDRYQEILKYPSLTPTDSARILLIIIEYWSENGLDFSVFEARLMQFIPQLITPITELLSLPRLPEIPFSSKLFLAVTLHSIEKFTEQHSLSSNFISEDQLWSQINLNLEKHTISDDAISVSVEAVKTLQANDPIEAKKDARRVYDSLIFSCGHTFTWKEFHDTILPEVQTKLTKSIISFSSKYIVEDFTHAFISHSCPNCLYDAVSKTYQVNDKKVIKQHWNNLLSRK